MTRPGPATRGRRAGASGAAAGPAGSRTAPPAAARPAAPGPRPATAAGHHPAPPRHAVPTRHRPSAPDGPAHRRGQDGPAGQNGQESPGGPGGRGGQESRDGRGRQGRQEDQGGVDRQDGRGRRGRRAGRGASVPHQDRFTPPYQLVELRVPDRPLRARVDPGRPAPGRRGPMTFASRSTRAPRGGSLHRFVRAYGWRAYAIPLLTVLTILCGMDVANGSTGGLPLPLGRGSDAADPAAQPPPAAPPVEPTGTPTPAPRPTSTRIYVDDGGGGATRPLPATALPPGGPYSKTGGGRYDIVPGTSRVHGTGPLRRYTVEVEAGVAEDGPAFAAAVEQILGSPRSWGAGGRMSFQRVDGGAVEFRVSLTASLTVRRLCGYTLPFETSCYNGELGRAVINDARWVRGAVAYAGNVAAYRSYVINHEVGHALGHEHEPCPKAGALAPVMMQQTLGVQTPGVGSCRPNAFPYP